MLEFLYKRKHFNKSLKKCGEDDICTLRISNESLVYCKNIFIRIRYNFGFCRF